MEEVSSLHWFVGWGVAAVVFACLVLVSAGPSTGWVSSVVAQEPECVWGGGGEHDLWNKFSRHIPRIRVSDPLGMENF